jgi:DNA-binding transcriptional LysR family regulator
VQDDVIAAAITSGYHAQDLNSVNLRQLSYCLAVAETGSFTRAAERLHVSQPGLSQQIRALEAELGGRLIERLGQGIRLTPAGRSFLPEARAAVIAAERAQSAARSAIASRTLALDIATLRSVAVGILPAAIRRLYELHPDATVGLREYRHRDELERDVRGGIADIAVGPRPRAIDGPVQRLGWEEFVLAVGDRDPLFARARTARVGLEEVVDRRWILFPPEHGLSVLISVACARAGFVPSATVHTEQVEAAVRLAAAGVGVALVPDDIVPAELDRHVRRLARPVVRELTAYTRNSWWPSAASFLEILREQPWRRRLPRNAEVIT